MSACENVGAISKTDFIFAQIALYKDVMVTGIFYESTAHSGILPSASWKVPLRCGVARLLTAPTSCKSSFIESQVCTVENGLLLFRFSFYLVIFRFVQEILS